MLRLEPVVLGVRLETVETQRLAPTITLGHQGGMATTLVVALPVGRCSSTQGERMALAAVA